MSEITYRKTKDGQWVAYGPADQIHTGAEVTVTKRDGTNKVETVKSVGRTFNVNGTLMVYGYLAASREPVTRAASAQTCAECGAGGATHNRTDSSGIPGKVCGRCSRQPSCLLSFA